MEPITACSGHETCAALISASHQRHLHDMKCNHPAIKSTSDLHSNSLPLMQRETQQKSRIHNARVQASVLVLLAAYVHMHHHCVTGQLPAKSHMQAPDCISICHNPCITAGAPTFYWTSACAPSGCWFLPQQ